jgi:flagellar hook-length control protein FliK
VAAAPAAQPQLADNQTTPGVRLHQAVETVEAVIRMAQSGGVTRARVALHPAELGGIEIHLRVTHDGLVARVVADHAQAAHVLRDAGGELRRQLESQGLNLVRFDVDTAGARDERRSAFAQADQGGSRRQGGDAPVDELDTTPDPTPETTVRLPNGVLVDVLA